MTGLETLWSKRTMFTRNQISSSYLYTVELDKNLQNMNGTVQKDKTSEDVINGGLEKTK